MTREAWMNIYVGNLSYDVTEADLQASFEAYGTVASVSIIKDQYSGQSKGFGFVEMPSASEARAAIMGLNGKDLMGRTLNVNEAVHGREAAARSAALVGSAAEAGGDDAGKPCSGRESAQKKPGAIRLRASRGYRAVTPSRGVA
jgi:RNA recognition motif-containing protein